MSQSLRVSVVVALLSASTAWASQFHVKTSGSSTGTGSQASPWSLDYALSHPPKVAAGDTIWVHPGTYPGHFSSKLTGTSTRPIIVRNYRGGRVTLEDRTGREFILAIDGGYTWFWGLEVRSVSTNLTNTSGVMMTGPGLKCINMIVHDCLASGINPFKDALDAEVYGSLIYYNGRQKERGGGAYGSYIQNVTGKKLIRDNIYHHNWSYAIHAYESGGADLDNMTFEGNAIFNNGLFYEANKFRTNLFVGGDAGHTADNNVFRDNCTFYSPTPSANQANVIGHTAGATKTVMEGNFWISPGAYAMMMNSVNNTITGNVFLGRLLGVSSATYPSNTYYIGWPSRPDDIMVRANRYESGRGHVYAYNWDQSGSIQADLSTVLDPGDAFEIRDAMNYYGSPVATGTYSGAKVTIPMTGLSAAAPQGSPVAPPIHPGPRFGAFVVIRTSGAPALPEGSLEVNPDTLSAGGGNVTLTWGSHDALAASISPGIGTVTGSGSLSFRVTETTTFRLTLTNAVGTSSYEAMVVVRLLPPGNPILSTPLDRTSDLPVPVTLRWIQATNANDYLVRVSEDPGFASVLAEAQTGAATSYVVRGLLHNREYFWKVQSRGPGGQSPWSSAWSFTTGRIPVSPLPVNLQGDAPEEQMVEVQLQKPATTDSAFLTLVAYDADGAGEGILSIEGKTSLALFGDLAESGNNKTVVPLTYRLPSAVFRSGPNRLFFTHTSTAGFRVDSIRVAFRAPPVGTLSVSPDTLDAEGGDVTLTWSSSGAISASISPAPGPVPLSGSHTVHVVQTTRFVLSMSNPAGTSTAAKRAVVRLPVPAVPGLGYPEDNSVLPLSVITFEWDSVAFGGSYRIQCALDEGFVNIVLDEDSITSRSFVPESLVGNTRYYWRVMATGAGGEGDWSDIWTFRTGPQTGVGERPEIPSVTTLEQNYPNPFNPSTVVTFGLARAGHVELAIFNILGGRVATLVDGNLPAGHHSYRFSPENLSGGIYLSVLKAGEVQQTRRMVYLK